MSKNPLHVAVVQCSSQDNVADNLACLRMRVAQAASAGAQLVVLPESCAFLGAEETRVALAESYVLPYGPILRELTECARQHRIFLVTGGMPESSEDPARPYNTSLLLDPAGTIRATYRKTHLFDVDLPDGSSFRESATTKPGTDLAVAEVHGVPLGITICYDVRFPALFGALTAQGARMISVSAAFAVATGKDHWIPLLRARAIENQVYILAAAQHGRHPGGRQTYGKSLIVDPWGDVVAQCSEGEGVALASIDLAYQDRVRAAIPCLKERVLREPGRQSPS